MDTYVYQAALWCESCALEVRKSIDTGGVILFADQHEDSEHYPQGPYPNGGGEADCPQHCNRCRVFLENPLTEEGVVYVQEAIKLHEGIRIGSPEVIARWREFYKDVLEVD